MSAGSCDLNVHGSWEDIFWGEAATALNRILPEYLVQRRWFGSKARQMRLVAITDVVHFPMGETSACILFVRVEYSDGFHETYTLPLAYAAEEEGDSIRRQISGAAVLTLCVNGEEGVVHDAMWNQAFTRSLLTMISENRTCEGRHGTLNALATGVFESVWKGHGELPSPRVHQAEQSNTTVFYGNEILLKLFRHLEPGLNPDFEIGRFLTEKANFEFIAPVLGALEYRKPGKEPMTVAIVHKYVENQGDAWQYAHRYLERYYQKTASIPQKHKEIMHPRKHLLNSLEETPPPLAMELCGPYLEQAGLLGRRTALFHLALASDPEDSAFSPEPFTDSFCRARYQSMHELASRTFDFLRNRMADIPKENEESAKHILDMEKVILSRLDTVRQGGLTGTRIRIHGDYHLGQVLHTGRDFLIIDFEGEPARSLDERRSKSSVLKDVSGMLRSFHYASWAGVFELNRGSFPTTLADMEPWRRLWHWWTSVFFLKGYLDTAQKAPFLPKDFGELRSLLDVYLLEKALYELGYELNNRPDWIDIPIQGIREIMGTSDQ